MKWHDVVYLILLPFLIDLGHRLLQTFEGYLLSQWIVIRLYKFVTRRIKHNPIVEAMFLHHHYRHPARSARVCNEGVCRIVPRH